MVHEELNRERTSVDLETEQEDELYFGRQDATHSLYTLFIGQRESRDLRADGSI